MAARFPRSCLAASRSPGQTRRFPDGLADMRHPRPGCMTRAARTGLVKAGTERQLRGNVVHPGAARAGF
jgi:hypothetical protein